MVNSLLAPTPQKYPPIDADSSIVIVGQQVLGFHFSRMVENEAGTILGEDIEALHDMRVATRRMRTAANLFREDFNPNAFQIIRKGLRKTGKRLGRVRDLDVLLENAQILYESQPQNGKYLEPIIEHWLNERQPVRRRMLVYLESEKYRSFKDHFHGFLNATEAQIQRRNDNPAARQKAPGWIHDHLENVRSYQQVLTNPSLRDLHTLRIAFKGLRYTIEFFYEILGQEVYSCIELLKTIQDHLGEINDARVALERLDAILEPGNLRNDLHAAAAQYQAQQQDQLANLIERFPATWNQFAGSEFEQNLNRALSSLSKF